MIRDWDKVIVVPKVTERTKKSMSFGEAVGLPYLDTPHDTFYDAVIDYLGGLDAVAPFVPATKEEIVHALSTENKLNSIPLKKWDAAAGFEFCGIKCERRTNDFQILLLTNGIRVYSPSECVCLLKRAAERIAKTKEDET